MMILSCRMSYLVLYHCVVVTITAAFTSVVQPHYQSIRTCISSSTTSDSCKCCHTSTISSSSSAAPVRYNNNNNRYRCCGYINTKINLRISNNNENNEEGNYSNTTTSTVVETSNVTVTDSDSEQNDVQNVADDDDDDDEELSNFLIQLKTNSPSTTFIDDMVVPIPKFTAILILLGSVYVTGYGLYVGLYGFPSDDSIFPRIF
jgi:hypothetical protein